MVKQRTIKESVTIKGVGLHNGDVVEIIFNPAKENTGRVFVRKDLEGSPSIRAHINNVVSTNRSTNISNGDITINTIEHVMAAIYSMEIDNIEMLIDGPEVPIMDGSAIKFIEAIQKAGIVEQDAPAEFIEIEEAIMCKSSCGSREIIAVPHSDYKVSAMVNTGEFTQNAVFNGLHDFRDNIANAKTFIMASHIEGLIDNDLIKGGSLDNAIVYLDKKLSDKTTSKLEKFFNYKEENYHKNEFMIKDGDYNVDNNQAAKHKLIDVVGDLALIGKRIKANIIAIKTGHSLNIEFAKKINDQIQKQKNSISKLLKNQNKSDINLDDITKLLPHRYPFLLVDKILHLSDNNVIGLKNVTFNEPFFVGHFPGNPVMPGVLQIESMAQVGGILIFRNVLKLKSSKDYLPYLIKIDNVKFKNIVVPGDTIIFELKIIPPVKRSIFKMKGVGYVNDKIVSEAELFAKIIKLGE